MTCRAAAVSSGQHDRFNRFMRHTVKSSYKGTRHNAMWNLLVAENMANASSSFPNNNNKELNKDASGLTLISTLEDSGSSFSVEQAARFFTEDDVPEIVPVAVEERRSRYV